MPHGIAVTSFGGCSATLGVALERLTDYALDMYIGDNIAD